SAWSAPRAWGAERRRDLRVVGAAIASLALVPGGRRLQRALERLGHPAGDALLEGLGGPVDPGVEVVTVLQRLEWGGRGVGERWEAACQPASYDGVVFRRPVLVGEVVGPEVDRLPAGARARRRGEHPRPAVTGGAQPGCPDDVDAGVPTVSRGLWLAGVQRH